MNALFVHQNFPAQLGQLAILLKRRYGWNPTYVTKWEGTTDLLPLLKYQDEGATTDRTHFLARNFENCIRASSGVYRAVRDAKLDPKPDVVIGHSGFGSTLFLGDLFGCPVVNLFEFFYRPSGMENPFRPEFAPEESFRRRIRLLNAAILLDLEVASAGYAPTHFQRNQFPVEYLPKIETLFDGIDDHQFRPLRGIPREICGRTIPDDVKIVTYVSRGFESMRGFDIFIRTAKRIYREYPKVLFVVAGSDRVCYGGDLRYIEEKSFREHVEKREQPDPDKFFYTGLVNSWQLVRMLSLSDVHIYFTVPFVLSWSMFNAMSCGCRIVSCNNEPVTEVIDHGWNGLLADFYDIEGHARNALQILRDKEGTDRLGVNARRRVGDRYSLNRTVPAFVRMIERVTGLKSPPLVAEPESGGAG